jgi:hypothetical protein
MEFVFELGQDVKSKINGFSGVVTGRVQYLVGNDSYQVTSKELVEGKSVKEWFEDDELVNY